MTDLIKIPYSLIRPIYEKTSFHKAVISEIEDNRLRFAYAHCRSITRKHAKTFYMATRFLPYHKQRGIFAIYGLCRTLDDIVDENEDNPFKEKKSRAEVINQLEKFRVELIGAYRGAEQTNSVLIAFADVLNRYNISLEHPLTLLDGVKMDLVKNRYDTFEELYEYSYKVASVVGLMTSEIFGYKDPQAINHAVELGIAMQLTNILRDVGEDLDRERIYIPREDLERFKVSEDEMFSKKLSGRFIDLMKFQIDRARRYYIEADKGIPMLNRDSRLPVLLARENYSRILNKIEENQYQVFNQRAYLNATEKFSILPKIIYQLKTDS
ncbi:phytoene/squalene synthase family protein [Rhodohalobacter sulfatireducens]|uniref:Phytoene/squalene synthase family protein n=1 Tax=Rhodohalobacter sulfatireducens TaxID=2911366 RepID=A0ABS9KJI5_9BACT|nr:phytoene/squalene synthase family protein [Rhodohalobacter sulfatireducens]MCG2591018.1 phytoene/squalene synthase family protein [Rhodohalobacter sulfatireducens]